MKKVITMIAMMATGALLAGVNDTVFSFQTAGVDRYADGSAVADGECYALVWVAANAEFKGFLADGTLADTVNNRTVLVAPVAENGRCPKTVVQISEKFMARLGKGSFAVVLLDTRVNGADGSVKLADLDRKGMPKAVAAIAVVEGDIKVDGGFAEAEIADAKVADTQTAAPADAPVPEIKGLSVKAGIVAITFANVVDYARYNVKGGETPDAIDGEIFSYDFNGEPDAKGEMTVCFAVESAARCGFFKIVRRN